MDCPSGVDCQQVPVRFDDANDVSPWPLLRYERRQRRLVAGLLRAQRFDVVHRVTPSGWKDSLLPVPTVPLILGPILLSEPAPPAFYSVFHPKLPRRWSVSAAVRRIQNGLARRVFQRWSTADRLLEHATTILVGTRTTLRRLPPGIRPRCRLVTYAGVEHDVYTPAPRRPANRLPQVLFAGRVVPYKGVELLLRAAARARRSCRFELKFVGGGCGRYRTYCTRLAAAMGLRDVVSFIDNQPRDALVSLYRAADVFCMPSLETYGLAILEAMSCGCAALVSDINGPGEIVADDCGVKVPLESPEQCIRQLADELVALIDDPQRRTELGGRARERMIAHHDWRRIQEELTTVYDSVLLERGAPAPLETSHIVAATP